MSIPPWLLDLLYDETRNPGKWEALKMELDKTFPPGFNYPGPTSGPFSEHPHGGRGRPARTETGPGEQGQRSDIADTDMDDMVTRIMRARGY